MNPKSPGRPAGPVRGIGVIISGTLGAQLITLAGYPALTRIYSTSDFGAYAFVYAWATLLFPLAALRLDVLVPIPAADEEAQSLVGVGLRLAVVVGLTGSLLLLVAPSLWTSAVDSRWFWTIPAFTGLIAGFQLLNAWGVRKARYSAIARRNVLHGLVLVVAQVAAGLMGAAAGGLLGGLGLAFLVSCAVLALGSGLKPRFLRERHGIPRRFRLATVQLSSAGLLNGAGLQAPLLLMTGIFGLESAGYFALAQQALAIPMALIGQAVAQVYLSRLAQELRDHGGTARRQFLAATRPLAMAALPIAVLAFFLSPLLFPLVFGPEWRTSGQMVAALSVSLGCQLVAAPVSQTLIVVGATRQQLIWDASRLVLIVGVFVLAGAAGLTPLQAVWAYSAVNAVAYAALWLLALRASARLSPHSGRV